MKYLIYISTIILLFTSCKKKNYHKFSGKELDFVNYSSGQEIRFIDTSSITYTMTQKEFVREFHEQISIFGATGTFTEYYETSYAGWSPDPDVQSSI